jgi:hypothetical protein
MSKDNRPLVDVPDSNKWEEMIKEEWEWLSSKEKATCLSYKMFLDSGKSIPFLISEEMNRIHENNPDFHVGFIPSDRPGTVLDFKKPMHQPMMADFSGYLPENPA